MTDDATYRRAVDRCDELERERDAALAECALLIGTLESRERNIETLQAECERFRADAERLDFVLDNCAFIQTTASEGRPNTYQLLTQDEDENYIELSGEGAWFPTPRAAIDAARGKP